MNRHKLRERLLGILREVNPNKVNEHNKDKTLYSRMYRELKINPPKSAGRMRESLKKWFIEGVMTREALLNCTYDTFLENNNGEIPKRLLVARSAPKDTRNVHGMVISNLPASKFYQTKEWKNIRYEALIKYGNRCQCCGASPRKGASLHVDHIRPRSIYPEFALSIDNLQILCEPCNIAKSNTNETNWRGA